MNLWYPKNDDDHDDEEEEESQDMPHKLDNDDKQGFMMFERMIKTRKILISSEINQKTADRIINALIMLEDDNNSKPIIMFINSPGGEVYSGFAIYDWMQAMDSPIYTVVSGFAASMGSIISLAASDGHRYAMPNAKVLIHQPLISGVFQGTTTEIEIHAKEMLRIKDRIVNIYAEKCKKSNEEIRKDIERDFWMTAQEAKDYGHINTIITKISELPT